jgi:phospholipid/cholesterol/gamma-HCH transport system substrate-binding protein
MRRRNRPASRPLSTLQIVGTAGAALFASLALIWLALVAPRGVPGIGYRYLNAQFQNAGNVPISTEVRIGGRHAGQVVGTSLSGGVATFRLQLLPGDVPVHSDATAYIGLKGLLGGKYVELDPGHAAATLRDGATLPKTQTSTALDILDVAQTFDAAHRRDLQLTVQGLGKGLLSRGPDISEILHDAAPVAGNTDAISTAILDRPGAAARLFPSAESLAAAFDPVRK